MQGVAPRPSELSNAGNRQIWLGSALLIGLVAFVFLQTTGLPFIENWDDGIYVSHNPHVLGGLSFQSIRWAFGAGYASNWHPLTWISHMLDVELFGSDAAGHHLTNVLLHASNSVLLFVVLSSLTKSVWRSLLTAALFAVHPLHVESVAWVAERKDVLSTFFLLLTLLSYGRFAREGRRSSYVLAMGFLALGLASKPMLVSTPALLLLLDIWPLNRIETTGARRVLIEKIPFFVLSVVSSALTIVAQRSGGAIVETQQLPFDARFCRRLSHLGLSGAGWRITFEALGLRRRSRKVALSVLDAKLASANYAHLKKMFAGCC